VCAAQQYFSDFPKISVALFPKIGNTLPINQRTTAAAVGEGDGEMDIQIEAFALVLSKGYSPKQITKINLAEDGSLASVELGTDADGFGIFILNFVL
jgi:hypothetical protein